MTAPAPASRAVDYLMLAFLGCVWGSSFLFIKVAVTGGIDPFTLAAARVLVAMAILWGAVLVVRQKPPMTLRFWLYMAALGLVGNAMPFTLLNAGQQLIDSGLGAILISTAPLFTIGLAHLFTDDRFTARKLIGLVLGFAGVIVLIGPHALAGLTDNIVGILFTVGGAFCFASTTVIARRAALGHPFVSAACSLTCGTLYLVPLAFLIEAPLAAEPTRVAWLGMTALAVISTGLAHIIFFSLTLRTGPNFVSMNNYISPAIGVLWGTILLSEAITWEKLGAVALIFVGVAVATSRRRVKPAPVPPYSAPQPSPKTSNIE